MAGYSQGAGYLMGHVSGQIGAVDSSVNAAVSVNHNGGTVSATVAGVGNAATMFLGKLPGIAGEALSLLHLFLK